MSATMTVPAMSKQALLIASDDDLVARAYLLSGLAAGDGETEMLSDEIFKVIGEIFERHLPDAYWRDTVREMTEAGVTNLQAELESCRDSMARRAAERLAARCSPDIQAAAS